MSNAKRPRRPPLPYDDAGHLADQLVTAAGFDDNGAELGRLAGLASLDARLAGTVIGILAHTAAVLGVEIATRDAN